jgi:hypothetical protein
VVEHLIAHKIVRDLAYLVEVWNVEVAYAPRQNLPVTLKLFERINRFRKRFRSTPMQQVTIQVVGPEPCKRSLASFDRAAARRVLRKHLRHQKHIVATPLNRLSHDLFGRARAIVRYRGRMKK